MAVHDANRLPQQKGKSLAVTSKPKVIAARTATASDLRGASRLVIDATTGITDLVEAMHRNIARVPVVTASAENGRASGIAGFVYRTVRGVTRVVGGGIDAGLALLSPALAGVPNVPAREAILSALNGVLGDHLAKSNNPLAITMQLRHQGHALTLTRAGISAQLPATTGKIVILVHGLCMNDLQWKTGREGLAKAHDHGAALQRDFGFTPLYLRYNSGRHVSSNGREFASTLKALLAAWPVPVESLVIVAHSMGGLVSRSAFHYGRKARHTWCKSLDKIVFLGTPHLGAPLERGGHWIDILLGATPYASPFAKLGKVRSAGITDLRHGSILDDDWRDQDRFEHTLDALTPVPLPAGVRCYTIAATIDDGAKTQSVHAAGKRMLGDGLVPLNSALGNAAAKHDDPKRTLKFPPENQCVLHGVNHMELLKAAQVYPVLKAFVAA
jgi:pimeloyl-ACP methyl ester carboxylesterase